MVDVGIGTYPPEAPVMRAKRPLISLSTVGIVEMNRRELLKIQVQMKYN